jgi:hypothetical protein
MSRRAALLAVFTGSSTKPMTPHNCTHPGFLEPYANAMFLSALCHKSLGHSVDALVLVDQVRVQLPALVLVHRGCAVSTVVSSVAVRCWCWQCDITCCCLLTKVKGTLCNRINRDVGAYLLLCPSAID